MRNNESYAQGFKTGWEKCRKWMCKEFHIKEEGVIELEEIDN